MRGAAEFDVDPLPPVPVVLNPAHRDSTRGQFRRTVAAHSDDTIPSDVVAVVANRSAIGEQYVDLQPQNDTGPYLRDGSTIERDVHQDRPADKGCVRVRTVSSAPDHTGSGESTRYPWNP